MDRELKSDAEYQSTGGTVRCTSPDCCGTPRLQNLPVAGGMKATSSFIGWLDIVSAFLALPPVAEGEMDAHERKARYQSERERLKFEQKRHNCSFRPVMSDGSCHLGKAVVQVLETLPDILERDCGLQPPL